MTDLKLINIVSFAEEHLASFRLRQKVIAEWINNNSNEWRVVISNLPDPDATVNLFHKHINFDVILKWVEILRETSTTKIVFDITDHFFDDKVTGQYYRQMCELSHLITVSSFGLQEDIIKRGLGTLESCQVIFEPSQLEWVTKEDREFTLRDKKYAWLGHKSNLDTLLPYIDTYGEELTIISNRTIPGIKCIEWYDGVEELLLNFETVLLPQPNPYKSPNRFVDAVIAGCKVETFGAPAYSMFPQDPELLKQTFNLANISKCWIAVFNQALETEKEKYVKAAHPCLQDKKYVKLNLGCGSKIYPQSEGWVNIDNGPNPSDLKADVRTINSILGNSVADEIHAYHVVEHFFPNEVQSIINDWVRTLKSGGKICIEMPDMMKAAKNLLQLETTGDPYHWNHLGLKAFYGDYGKDYGDMLNNCHKWLYTFKTFEPILTKAGFTDIEEQTPQTHFPTRDFRIIGYKT